MLANANRVVSAERLRAYLWDEPPKSAAKLLQVYVHKLRQELDDPEGNRLRTRDPGYLLEIRPGELDADEFTRIATRGLQAEHQSTAAACFREALALWRGPAFEDLRCSAPGRLEGVQLNEKRLTVMESLFQTELACGRHRELTGELTAAVRGFPLRERFYEQLILALGQDGRRSDAVAVYHELSRTLAAELGVRPSATATRLIHEVMGARSGGPVSPPKAAVRASAAAAVD